MTDTAPARGRRIIVEPAATGWSVQVAGADNPMVFASERSAETAARDLALRLAKAGGEVEVERRLQGGAFAGLFICFPAPEPDDAPLAVHDTSVRGGPR